MGGLAFDQSLLIRRQHVGIFGGFAGVVILGLLGKDFVVDDVWGDFDVGV